MNVTDFIIKLFPGITSFGPWLSKKGMIYAVVLGVGLAFFLMAIGFIPTPPADPNATTFPLWHVLYLVGFPVVFVVIWFGLTQGYLRSGQGTKIGLAYDGYAVDMGEWRRTKGKLCDLLRKGQITNRVTLRFVPISACTEDKRANRFMKRYGFNILTTVRQSPSMKNDPNNAQHPISTYVSLRIVTKVAEQQFLETILKNALEIIRERKTGPTLADVLDAHAQNLHDMMLLFVASHCYLKKKYEDSNAILQYLDDSLSSIMRPDQSPRQQIRLLAVECCLRPSQFSLKEIPPLDMLLEIRKSAEAASRFFDDSYLVPIGLARIRFLTGDTDGAIELTRKYGDKIQKVKASGQRLAWRVLPAYYLNLGFLSFIQCHWVNACDAYKKMLAIDEYRNENWPEIINFIDYVQETERHEGICYLQMLYRLIAGKAVPAATEEAAQEWVGQDDSRQELRKLLSRNYASLPKPSSQKTLKSKKQSRKSKRKIKPRKNRGKKR